MWSAPATRTARVTQSHSTAIPPREAPEVGQCPAVEGEDSRQQSRSQGSRGECRLSCDSSQGGEGAEEISKVWEEQHGGEDHHHPRCPGGHRKPNRHWPGGHCQSQCPEGQHDRHWPGGHRQSQCPGGQHDHHWPGGQPDRHWPGGHRQSLCQEGSPIVTGQEATARVCAQEATASHSPAAQEGPGSHSPAAQ
ncbi:hypothetical protein NDU88_003827 [Pleurodeles waltl]|uniref:Uncharacterized protein n=1 Tax=Pleurodeles waltl TaxID=8319 RepID=A0AAV7QEA0_PLEWA|nr:hypothetical protein NDU88_003827 [Pleurodeles waltl]